MSKLNQMFKGVQQADCELLMQIMLAAGRAGLLERGLQDALDSGKVSLLRRLVTSKRR